MTHFSRLRNRTARATQCGAMLIEALIALLIFSLGILGVVGLQATAIQQSTDARYRMEAAQLVERLIGQMWTSDRTVANLQTQFNNCTSGACVGYADWYAAVAATLPGVAIVGLTAPTVNVDANGLVTITVFWRAPTDAIEAAPHRYSSSAQIQQ
jgi:type IV pilus assembly protein PilV